jgi:lipoprotein NlpD
MNAPRRIPKLLLSALMVSLLAACATPRNQAPVEDRKPPKATARPAAGAASAPVAVAPAMIEAPMEPAKPLPPGAENAGKPGYYTVKPGDTLIRIGLENGQNWRDVVRWNGIENANLIEVGQVLRVVPPSVDPSAVAARGVTAPKVDVRPLDARPGAPGAGAAPAEPPAVAGATQPARDSDDEPAWSWPAAGNVLAGFDESKQKGLAINGKAGDPVLAAADGRVVYAGSGLRGYGNLVIVKHNNIYLSAYAHNQALLVKEDQVVRRGQKIAEMGASDADRVQLHFEIRRQGKPIDPAKLLPTR